MRKRSQGSILWNPETLREYMDLAYALGKWDDDFYPLRVPPAPRIQDAANLMETTATSLIFELRKPQKSLSYAENGDYETNKEDVFGEIQHPWILMACTLWQHIDQYGYAFEGDNFCVKYWPRSPNVEAFGEVGRAALEVIDLFAGSVAWVIFNALKSACGRNKYEGLVYELLSEEDIVIEPMLEHKGKIWLKEARRQLAKRFPASEWTKHIIELESRRLACQLEYEAREADLASTEQNAKVVKLQPKETSKDTIRDQVFICYSRKDKRWLNDLQTHLKPYVRNRSVTVWSDEQIQPGAEWFEELKKALSSTKVAILLVTKYFLASDFIHEHELGPLLKRADKGDVRIIWIPVGACAYKKSPLKNYQAVIATNKPLANMKKPDCDKAWVEICEEIEKAALEK